MKKIKAIMIMMVMAAALSVMTPVTASATPKKKTSLTVTTDVKLSDTSKPVVYVKEKIQLKVKYGKKNVTSKAVYTSSNKKVVTVNKKGKLTVKKPGKCTITVKYKGRTKKLKLVSRKPELNVTPDIKFDRPNYPPTDRDLIKLENKTQLAVKYGNKNVTSKAVYKSSDNNIVEVTKNGKLVPKKPGICDITIKYKGKTKTLKLLSHEHIWEIDYRWRDVLTGYNWYCDICEAMSSDTAEIHQAQVHNDTSGVLKGHYTERYICYGCLDTKPLD